MPRPSKAANDRVVSLVLRPLSIERGHERSEFIRVQVVGQGREPSVCSRLRNARGIMFPVCDLEFDQLGGNARLGCFILDNHLQNVGTPQQAMVSESLLYIRCEIEHVHNLRDPRPRD
jgi:hypothetical protein